MAPYAVFLLRLLVPFSILRWPFLGVLLSIAADASDVIILDAFGWGFLSGWDYHAFDKVFDIYYLAFAAYAAASWDDTLARRTALTLFSWRFLGFLAFELTHVRQVTFFAPNIFENFYLLFLGIRKFSPAFQLNSKRKLVLLLLIAGIPKIIQEYIMHYLEFPTWHFIKTYIFRWR